MKKTSLSIIIPAYNESESIDHTLTTLRPVRDLLNKTYDVEIIFVNDGSRDNTADLLSAAIADDPTMRLVSYTVNKGLGGAIRTGFKEATGDIVVTTDFDGTYHFDTIPEIVAKLEDSGMDIVNASPYHKDGAVVGVPQYRLLFSYGASLLYRILVSNRIATWTALFRAYRQPVIKSVEFESNDFLAGTEILVRAIQKGFTVAEYPTDLHSREFGQSSIRIMKVTAAHLKFQSRLITEAIGIDGLLPDNSQVLPHSDLQAKTIK
ncbi:MAG: glycosyltransferase family 2 protein [Aggregatilineales bacterium]